MITSNSIYKQAVKMRTVFFAFHLFVAASILSACSSISEDERLVYVEPASSDNAVLIEDFTGQRCVNCPNATKVIEEIVNVYGEDRVIPVAIHCGPFGFTGNATIKGLMTDLGKTYWAAWFTDGQGQPVAKINRGIATGDYANWTSLVGKAMEVKTQLNFSISTSYDEDSRNLTINTSALGLSGTTAKYQLWLTEDSIVAMQLQPDGSRDSKYVHNHVLRAAINGEWGESVTLGDKSLDLTHTYTIPSDYVADNCAVVAFFYDENGVLQVAKKKLKH